MITAFIYVKGCADFTEQALAYDGCFILVICGIWHDISTRLAAAAFGKSGIIAFLAAHGIPEVLAVIRLTGIYSDFSIIHGVPLLKSYRRMDRHRDRGHGS